MKQKINSSQHDEPNKNNKYEPQDRWLEQSFVDDQLEMIFSNEDRDGSFLYAWKTESDSGWMRFDRVAHTPIYEKLVTENESKILSSHTRFAKSFEKSRQNIIEIGPWWGDKFARLIASKFKISNKWYIGVDISDYSLKKAGEYARQLHMQSILLLNDRGSEKIYTDNKWTVLFLGWSIGNLHEREIVKLLRNMAHGAKRDIVLSHFLAPDGADRNEKIQEIVKIYYMDEMKKFVMWWFESLGLDVSQLEFTVEYREGENGEIKTWKNSKVDVTADKILLGAKLKQDIIIEVNGKKLIKKEGDFIQAISSRRFSKGQFAQLAEAAWCKLIDTVDDGGVAISILRSPGRNILKEYIEKNKQLVIGVLLLSWWIVLAEDMVLDYKQKKHEEKISKARQSDLYGREISHDQTSLELINAINEDLDETVTEAESILKDRYGRGSVESYEGKVLMGLLKKYFIDMDIWEFNGIKYYQQGLSRKVDKFVQEFKGPILEGGYNIIPNGFLSNYSEYIRNTFATNEEVKVDYYWSAGAKGTSTTMLNATKGYTATSLSSRGGTVYGVQIAYDLARVKLNGKKVFVAKIHWIGDDNSNQMSHHNEYSLALGKEAVKEYLDGWYLHQVAERVVQVLYERLHIDNLPVETRTTRIEEILLQARVEGYDFSLFLNEKIPIDYVLNTFIFPVCWDKLENIGADNEDYPHYRIPLHAENLDVKDLCNDTYDLRPAIDNILHILNEDYDVTFMESIWEVKSVEVEDYPEVRNSIFTLLVVSWVDNISEILRNRIATRQWIEKNHELFVAFGYRVFPFEVFQKYSDAFERTLHWSDSALIGKGVIMPQSIWLYTTLTWERFNIAPSPDSKEQYIIAYPINKSAQATVKRLQEEYNELFAQFRFKKSFAQLEDIEKKITRGVWEYQFDHFSAIAWRYIAEDFFKQVQARNAQPNSISIDSTEWSTKEIN